MPPSKKLLACLAAALTVGAISAPTASGATEVGSNCGAATGAPNYTLVQLSQAPGSPLPLAAPAAGVVTKWNVNAALEIPPGFIVSERMRVLRPTGAPNEFKTIAESSPGIVHSGANTFETQIPVQAGDRFGAYAPTGSAVLFCATTNPADVIGAKESDVAPGGTATYPGVEKNQLALSVTIEPDVDGDGFGDETQDKCPQSAAVHLFACPPLLIEAAALSPGKGSVRILAASSIEANVTASASAALPKTKKATSSATTTLTPITQIVKPGQLAGYTLNFTSKLKQSLASLPKSKSVKLKVTVSGQNPAAQLFSDTLTVKLKGQAKPKK